MWLKSRAVNTFCGQVSEQKAETCVQVHKHSQIKALAYLLSKNHETILTYYVQDVQAAVLLFKNYTRLTSVLFSKNYKLKRMRGHEPTNEPPEKLVPFFSLFCFTSFM